MREEPLFFRVEDLVPNRGIHIHPEQFGDPVLEVEDPRSRECDAPRENEASYEEIQMYRILEKIPEGSGKIHDGKLILQCLSGDSLLFPAIEEVQIEVGENEDPDIRERDDRFGYEPGVRSVSPEREGMDEAGNDGKYPKEYMPHFPYSGGRFEELHSCVDYRKHEGEEESSFRIRTVSGKQEALEDEDEEEYSVGYFGQGQNKPDMDEIHQEIEHPVLTGIEEEFQKEGEHTVGRLDESGKHRNIAFLMGSIYKASWNSIHKCRIFPYHAEILPTGITALLVSDFYTNNCFFRDFYYKWMQ